MRRAPVLAVMLLSAVTPASAQPSTLKDYYTVDEKSVSVVKIGDLPRVHEGGLNSEFPRPIQADPLADIGVIINIGKQVWDVIVANKPVVDVQTQSASAMPQGITEPAQLHGWSAPEATVYEIRVKNLYGQQVVYMKYAVLRTSGGMYKGKGKFLTDVAVQPLDLEVLWGYKFSMNARAKGATNAGSEQDPVAAMSLVLDWKIETPIKDTRVSEVYYVQGDGVFKDVARGTGAHKVVGPFHVPRWDFRL